MRQHTADFLTFQNSIAASLTRRFPSVLADRDDNVGLTVGALREVERGGSGLVMLCVDLTEQVLAEAVAQRCDFIVTYSCRPGLHQRTRRPSLLKDGDAISSSPMRV